MIRKSAENCGEAPQGRRNRQLGHSTLWISVKSVRSCQKAWTPVGWSKREFPWKASEVETQLNTKKWVFAEVSNLVFLYFSWVSTSDAHIEKVRVNLRGTAEFSREGRRLSEQQKRHKSQIKKQGHRALGTAPLWCWSRPLYKSSNIVITNGMQNREVKLIGFIKL